MKERDELVQAALAVRARAYAPYSNYRVGAAILAADGQIFTGVMWKMLPMGCRFVRSERPFFA
jgi:cytidine deaminase